jgi:hypothetical protein
VKNNDFDEVFGFWSPEEAEQFDAALRPDGACRAGGLGIARVVNILLVYFDFEFFKHESSPCALGLYANVTLTLCWPKRSNAVDRSAPGF